MVLLYVPSTIVKGLFDSDGNNMSFIDRHINNLRLGYNAQKINTISSVLAFRNALNNYKSLSNSSQLSLSGFPRYTQDSSAQVNQTNASVQTPDQFSQTQDSSVQASQTNVPVQMSNQFSQTQDSSAQVNQTNASVQTPDQFSQTQDSSVQASQTNVPVQMSSQFSQTQDRERFNFMASKAFAQQKSLPSMAMSGMDNVPISLPQLHANTSFDKASNKPANMFNDELNTIVHEGTGDHHIDRHLFLRESTTPLAKVGRTTGVNDGLLDLIDLNGDRDFVSKQKEEFANIIKANVDIFFTKTAKAEGLLNEFNKALLYYASKDKVMYNKFDNDSFNISKDFFDLNRHKEVLDRVFSLQSRLTKEFNDLVDKDASDIYLKKDHYIKLFGNGIKSIYKDFYFDLYVKNEDFAKEYNKIFDHYIYDYIDYQKKIKLESFYNLHNMLFDIVKNSEEIFIEKDEFKADAFKKIFKDLEKKTFNVSSELQQKINHLFLEYDDSLNKLKTKNVYNDYVNNANKLSKIREKIETQYNGYLDDAIKKYQDIFGEFDSKTALQKGLKESLLDVFNKKLKQEMHVNYSEHSINSIGNSDILPADDKIKDPLAYTKEDILINFHHKVNDKIDVVKSIKNATNSKVQKIESLLELFKDDDKDFFDSVFVNDSSVIVKFIEKYQELSAFYDEIELMASNLDDEVRLMAEEVSDDVLFNKCNASFDDFASTVDYRISEYYGFFENKHNDINSLFYSYADKITKRLIQKQDEHLEVLVKKNIDLINKLSAELISNIRDDYDAEKKEKFVNDIVKRVEDLYLDGYKNIIKNRNQLIDSIVRQNKSDPIAYYELCRNSLKNTVKEFDMLAVDAQKMMDSEMRSFVRNAYSYDSHKTFRLNSLINDLNFIFYDLNDNVQKYRTHDYLIDDIDLRKNDALVYLEEKINDFFNKESLVSKGYEGHKESIERFLDNDVVSSLIKVLESSKKYFDLYGYPYNSLGFADIDIDIEMRNILKAKLNDGSNFVKLFNQILKYFKLDKSDGLLIDDQKTFFSLKAIEEFIIDFEKELTKDFFGNTEKVYQNVNDNIQSENTRFRSFNASLNVFVDDLELLREKLVIPEDTINHLKFVTKEFNDLIGLVKSKQDDFSLTFIPNFLNLSRINTETVNHLNSLISKKIHHINEGMDLIKNNLIQLYYNNNDSQGHFVKFKDRFIDMVNEFNKNIYSCPVVRSAIEQYPLTQDAIYTKDVDRYSTNSSFETESTLTSGDYSFDPRRDFVSVKEKENKKHNNRKKNTFELEGSNKSEYEPVFKDGTLHEGELENYSSYDALAQKNPNDFNTAHNAIYEDTQKHYKDYSADHKPLDREIEKKDYAYKSNSFDSAFPAVRKKSISKHKSYNDLRANFDDVSWNNKHLSPGPNMSDVMQEIPHKNQTTESVYFNKPDELNRNASVYDSFDSVSLQGDSLKGGNYSHDSNKGLFSSDKHIDRSEKLVDISDYKEIKRSDNEANKKEVYDISDEYKSFAAEFNSYGASGRSTPKNLSDKEDSNNFEMSEFSDDVVKKYKEIDRENLLYENSSFLNGDTKKSTISVNNDLFDDVSSDYVDRVNVSYGYRDKVNTKDSSANGYDSLKSFGSYNDKLADDNKLIADTNSTKKKQDKVLPIKKKKMHNQKMEDHDESFVLYDVPKKENTGNDTFYTKMLNIIDFFKNAKHDSVVDQKYKEMTMGDEILMNFIDHSTLKDEKLSADYANKAFISFKKFFSNIEAYFGFNIFYNQSDAFVDNINKSIKEYIGDSLPSKDVERGIKKINKDINSQNKKVLEKLNSLRNKMNDMQSSGKSFVKVYDIMDDTLHFLNYIKDYNAKIKKSLDSLSVLMAGDNPDEVVNLRLKLYKYLYKINILTLCHIENYAQDFSNFGESFLTKVKNSNVVNIKANNFNFDKFIKDVSKFNGKMLENIENKSHKEINELSDMIRKKTFVFFSDAMKIAATNGTNIVSHGHKDLLSFIEELSKKLKLSESDKLIKAANIIRDDELKNYNKLLMLVRGKKEYLLNKKDSIMKQYYKLFDLYLGDLEDIYAKKDLFVDVNEFLQCFFDFVNDCDKKYSEFQKSSETFFDELYDLVKLHKSSSLELKKNTSSDIEGFIEKRKKQHILIYNQNLNKDLQKSTRSKLIDAAKFVVSRAKKPFMRKKSEKFTDRFNLSAMHSDRRIKKGKESDTESNIGL